MPALTNPTHILLVLVVVLIVFGAKRLPEAGRSLGSGLREFRDSMAGNATGQIAEATDGSSLPVAPATARTTGHPADAPRDDYQHAA